MASKLTSGRWALSCTNSSQGSMPPGYEVRTSLLIAKKCAPTKASLLTRRNSPRKLPLSTYELNSLAISLLEKLCHPKPSARYKADQALQHPWITRNFEDKIPRTLFEEAIFQSEIDSRLRQVITFEMKLISRYAMSFWFSP